MASAQNLLVQLYESAEKGRPLGSRDFNFLLSLAENGETPDLQSLLTHRIAVAPVKGFVSPQTAKQREYIQAIEEK